MTLAAALSGVVDALGSLGIGYQVGGSVASSAHGTARSTLDVDLVAPLRVEHVEPLCARLRGEFYAEPELVRSAIALQSCVNFLHFATGYKVDVFVLRDSEYDRVAFARSVDRALIGDASRRMFRMATAEDILIRKLLCFRATDETSDRQWHDVLGVIRVQGDALDRRYVSHWANALSIGALLDRAFAQRDG